MASSSKLSEKNATPPAPSVPWECLERFVGQLTHDVRNGLNALELQLTFLGEISTDKEAVEEVRQLRRTLGDVTRQLQAVKTATGAVSSQTLEYPAGELFEDLRERFERQHAESAPKVRWNLEMGDVQLEVDPELCIVALLELLTNAVRFGDGESEIALSARADADSNQAVVTLLEPKAKNAPPLVTERWGMEPLRSTRRGAYGLGLFRARRIIEAQGGTINAIFSSAAPSLTTVVKLPLGAGTASRH